MQVGAHYADTKSNHVFDTCHILLTIIWRIIFGLCANEYILISHLTLSPNVKEKNTKTIPIKYNSMLISAIVSMPLCVSVPTPILRRSETFLYDRKEKLTFWLSQCYNWSGSIKSTENWSQLWTHKKEQTGIKLLDICTLWALQKCPYLAECQIS